jgi:hypothetical protein
MELMTRISAWSGRIEQPHGQGEVERVYVERLASFAHLTQRVVPRRRSRYGASHRDRQHFNPTGLMRNSALFLDRDGVINVDHGYVHRPDEFEFVPGIFQLARFWTNELHRPIVVVSNQSGIGPWLFR